MSGRPRRKDDDLWRSKVARDDELEVFGDEEVQKLVDRTWRLTRDDTILPFGTS